jgi:hypothetical protein
MLTNKELSTLMHAYSEKIMRDKEWMDADCAEDISATDEFERDVWSWTDATAYPGCELLNCQDIAARIFRELEERGVAAIE